MYQLKRKFHYYYSCLRFMFNAWLCANYKFSYYYLLLQLIQITDLNGSSRTRDDDDVVTAMAGNWLSAEAETDKDSPDVVGSLWVPDGDVVYEFEAERHGVDWLGEYDLSGSTSVLATFPFTVNETNKNYCSFISQLLYTTELLLLLL